MALRFEEVRMHIGPGFVFEDSFFDGHRRPLPGPERPPASLQLVGLAVAAANHVFSIAGQEIADMTTSKPLAPRASHFDIVVESHKSIPVCDHEVLYSARIVWFCGPSHWHLSWRGTTTEAGGMQTTIRPLHASGVGLFGRRFGVARVEAPFRVRERNVEVRSSVRLELAAVCDEAPDLFPRESESE